MQTKVIITISIALLSYAISSAQVNSSFGFGKEDLSIMSRTPRIPDNGPMAGSFDKPTILGSAYTDSSFQEARVNNGEAKFKLRYNNYTDSFEYEKSPTELMSLSKDQNTQINFLDGRTYVLKNYKIGKETKEGYLLLVAPVNKKLTLYKSQLITFIPAKENNGYDTATQAAYKPKAENYFFEFNGALISYQKDSDLVKAFPEYAKEIKSFLKQNNFNPNLNQDVIRVQKYLLTLL